MKREYIELYVIDKCPLCKTLHTIEFGYQSAIMNHNGYPFVLYLHPNLGINNFEDWLKYITKRDISLLYDDQNLDKLYSIWDVIGIMFTDDKSLQQYSSSSDSTYHISNF